VLPQERTCVAAVLLLGLGLPAGTVAAYTWAFDELPIVAGPFPSMTLKDGVLPVLSNYYAEGLPYEIWERTPSGQWDPRTDLSGFVAGDGGNTIISAPTPVKFGQDSRFYRAVDTGGAQRAAVLADGSWIPLDLCLSYVGGYALCVADPLDRVYLVGGFELTMSGEDTPPVVPLTVAAHDLTISPFGDIAISGPDYAHGLMPAVTWFDYKFGSWRTRYLGDDGTAKSAIAFDSQGNLGVAYTYGHELYFSYLDFKADRWTDTFVTSLNIVSGTALAFDRNDHPVIAAGRTLAYNPIPVCGDVNHPYPKGDFNQDCHVNWQDFEIFAQHWLRCDCGAPDWCGGCDLDQEGCVNWEDFGIFAEHWLECTAPQCE